MGTPGNGGSEPKVTMTVKELIELHGQQIVAEVRTLGTKVDRLELRVEELDDKVADLGADDRAASAIRQRDDRSYDRAADRATTRTGQLVGIIGITASLLLGVANMAVILVIAHG
jgi:outer membrane murein-binding lipoprotein Lpp